MKKRNIFKFVGALGIATAMALGGYGKVRHDSSVGLESKVQTPQMQIPQKSGDSKPVKECVMYEGAKDGTAKTALYLQMEEFPDLSPTDWIRPEVSGGGTNESAHFEPLDYTREKWNKIMNPAFCKEGTTSYGDDFDYKSNISTNDVDARLLQDKIDASRDRIVYAIFSNPKDVFEYLKSWKGKKVDRIILHGHGYDQGFGQDRPKGQYISINDLRKEYSKKDFSDLLGKDGQVLLHACSTYEGGEHNLTFAEFVSSLFNAPTTGALEPTYFMNSGLTGPVCRTPQGARWYRTDGTPRIQNYTSTPFKTAYPDKVKDEVSEFCSTRAPY